AGGDDDDIFHVNLRSPGGARRLTSRRLRAAGSGFDAPGQAKRRRKLRRTILGLPWKSMHVSDRASFRL
ncbi:MAG: hypothetical protein ACXWC4_22500, partial [Telluria sp.]